MSGFIEKSTTEDVEPNELPDSLTADDLVPVEDVTSTLRGLFKGFNKFDDTYIVGEVGDLSPSSDHLYFTLTAGYTEGSLDCVVWQSRRRSLDISLESDMLVAAAGELTFFEAGGHPSLEVKDLHLVGESAYWQRIKELKSQLAAEGLFADSRKSELPRFPATIGVATAAGSDAEQDVIDSIHSRYPDVDILIQDTAVQGEGAPEELATAVDTLDAADTDIVIVTRGGGGDATLRVFNEEPIVRAVADAETPTVSAIGHDADEPLVDQVADTRAKTPTAAGDLVVEKKAELRESIDHMTDAISQSYRVQVSRWIEERRNTVQTAMDNHTTQWVQANEEAIDRGYRDTTARWLTETRRDVATAYDRLANSWFETTRTTIKQETERIKREHEFEVEKEGLERRNQVLLALLVLVVGLLLAVIGFILVLVVL